MKLTNIYNLPQPIFDAVANDPYDKGDADYSVSGLLIPERINALRTQYIDELEEDVTDRIFSLIGQAVHHILERAERTALAEKRFYMQVGDKRISGKLDRFIIEQGKIQDYKVTSLWKIANGCPKDFEEQVNSYAELMRQNGFEVRLAEIVAMLRDWHKTRTLYDPSYPIHQVVVIPVRLWTSDQCQDFLADRIRRHELAKTQLPLCSDEDMWRNPDEYAVVKEGGKRAIRKYLTREEAEAHAKLGGDNYSVQERKGHPKRCEAYCNVSQHCSQFDAMKAIHSPQSRTE